MENELKFNSQICTTIEQSQRLLELGLKPETADCQYAALVIDWKGNPILNPKWRFYNHNKGFIVQNFEQMESISAWSLHRLKCLLPTKIPYESGYLTVEIINNVNLMFMSDTSEQRVISFIHENLYESMIKCIKWFIKEGYFNKEYLK